MVKVVHHEFLVALKEPDEHPVVYYDVGGVANLEDPSHAAPATTTSSTDSSSGEPHDAEDCQGKQDTGYRT